MRDRTLDLYAINRETVFLHPWESIGAMDSFTLMNTIHGKYSVKVFC